MLTIMCVGIPIGGVYIKARGVKKGSIPDIVKVELANISIVSGIVYPDVDRFLYGPDRPVSSLYDAEVVWCGIVSCCWLCTWMGVGSCRCCLYLTPRVLPVSAIYSSSHAISLHW